MTSATTLFKELLNVNNTIVDEVKISYNKDSDKLLIAKIHPRKGSNGNVPPAVNVVKYMISLMLNRIGVAWISVLYPFC